jgi:hypothetical protein
LPELAARVYSSGKAAVLHAIVVSAYGDSSLSHPSTTDFGSGTQISYVIRQVIYTERAGPVPTQ